ncbi:MAG: DUF2723 domain-containing protein [Saprospiraceae bacterium]
MTNITGWLVFVLAAIVYILSAEPTGSLWDCGEFILGAYKMEVVHPPGAPLYMIVGRIFIWFAEIFTDTEANPDNIAHSVNIMSGICTAFGAMMVAWVAMILGKMAMVGREGTTDSSQNMALAGAGLVTGLSMTFCSSIWFSAVEGEVYAMSTFFTCLTLWSMIKWYNLPDTPSNDRWLVFTVYAAALSIGVHLLSLLTFPALALFYYFKKYKEHTLLGMGVAAAAGVVAIVAIQKLVITGIAEMWKNMEILTVNSFGLPFHSGLVPTLLIIAALFYFSLRWAHKHNHGIAQMIIVSAMMCMVGFSTIGVILVRANADPPINMNRPSDPIRLLSYVNREQYGERPLLYGPNFDAQPVDNEIEKRYGQVVKMEDGKEVHRYEYTDEKLSYKYRNSDKSFFPRMGDDSQGRPEKYRQWINKPNGSLTFFDNVKYLIRYQFGWMYWRYFAWNFIGRQNGEQGQYEWDKKSGHWESGIKFIDEARLYNMDKMTDTMKKHRARNHYFFLPFLFGLIGLFYHYKKRPKEFMGLLALFIITGIGIIVYSNQPPSEPRERDYVLVGSFFTYCIWIGFAVLALFDFLKNKMSGVPAAGIASLLVLIAPVLMGTQNWDDHSRAGHTGSRDYASNFLESCEPNAIIFTYGDNDTYPLWYAQEVENIRTDVRVVNLSLIQVDWYINLLRRKVNDSPPVKLTIPAESYRGKLRNAVFHYDPGDKNQRLDILDVLKFIGEDHELKAAGGRTLESFLPTKNTYIQIDSLAAVKTGNYDPADSLEFVSQIPLKLPGRQYITKDELAILDVIASNINDRPVYFAVTCRPEKMFGLNDYMQLEGLGLRIVPVKSKSEQGLYVYGYGRADTDKIYDRVMNKWKWGNFDTHETFIDRSYGPSIQSMRVVILRAARNLKDEGDNERAIALIEKYLSAFPHFNFPYDWNTMQLLSIMIEAGGYEKAKPHLEILANETLQQLEFYNSLDSHFTELGGDFEQDFALAMNTKETIIRAAKSQKDDAYVQQLEEMFKDFPMPTRNRIPLD